MGVVMGMFEEVCAEADAYERKLSRIQKLVDLPSTTQVCTDWRSEWLLDAIRLVLKGKPVLLGDGTLFIPGE